jgi:septum formation protein
MEEILKHLEKYEIILGSRSPRRQYLMKELGLSYTTKVLDHIDESYPPHLKREEIPLYLAQFKASAYHEHLADNTLLITADTIVWLSDKVLNKPASEEGAYQMLEKLSGQMHEVVTGVCIKTMKQEIIFHDVTKVYFKDLSPVEMTFYIENYKPFDKAGAYGIQEFIGYIGIDRIEGSYFNVMGLPVHALYDKLKSIS